MNKHNLVVGAIALVCFGAQYFASKQLNPDASIRDVVNTDEKGVIQEFVSDMMGSYLSNKEYEDVLSDDRASMGAKTEAFIRLSKKNRDKTKRLEILKEFHEGIYITKDTITTFNDLHTLWVKEGKLEDTSKSIEKMRVSLKNGDLKELSCLAALRLVTKHFDNSPEFCSVAESLLSLPLRRDKTYTTLQQKLLMAYIGNSDSKAGKIIESIINDDKISEKIKKSYSSHIYRYYLAKKDNAKASEELKKIFSTLDNEQQILFIQQIITSFIQTKLYTLALSQMKIIEDKVKDIPFQKRLLNINKALCFEKTNRLSEAKKLRVQMRSSQKPSSWEDDINNGIWLKQKCPASTPRMGTVQRCKTVPVIDGELSDKAWDAGVKHSAFILLKKQDLASLQTIFCAIYDSNALYIAAYAIENDFTSLQSSKNAPWSKDSFELFIWPENQGISYGQIAISPANDIVHYRKWNEKPVCKAGIMPSGWSAEFKITAKDLGIEKFERGMSLRMNLNRNKSQNPKFNSMWSDVGGDFHNKKMFGIFTFE